MIGLLTYLLPRAHTSMTRSITIMLALAFFGGFGFALAEALPELLQGIGWQGAPDNDVVAVVKESIKLATTLPFLVALISSKIAFLERIGMIHLPDVEFVLAWIGSSLKDLLRISPRIKDRQ
ncbi:hypothetical protein [Dongia deserti]|uniref:hypothetical protein n=1 Tax=Dongia deserti TaxID=2268030 RepID=UPI000E65C18C|nr:hypothetical protein [Dongia deserti]